MTQQRAPAFDYYVDGADGNPPGTVELIRAAAPALTREKNRPPPVPNTIITA